MSVVSSFHTCAAVRERLARAVVSGRGEVVELGLSEAGRPIDAYLFGDGPLGVSLIAGAHADEPVGPETLRHLILDFGEGRVPSAWRDRFRFVIVPHVNPDGEVRNRPWIERWPDVRAFIQHVDREPPGRDLEFGFPDMRVENRLVAGLLRRHGPFALHMSLHGMAFSEGAMLLINRPWAERTGKLRKRFVEAVHGAGLPLHDHDRAGEKGFDYLGPGFTTTPLGRAMQAHFRERGDLETAARFHLSSMEFVQDLGRDPLCLVTELPLFLVRPDPDAPPGDPRAYLAFKDRLPELKLRLERGQEVSEALESYGIQALSPEVAMRLQRQVIAMGLEAVRNSSGGTQPNSQRTM